MQLKSPVNQKHFWMTFTAAMIAYGVFASSSHHPKAGTVSAAPQTTAADPPIAQTPQNAVGGLRDTINHVRRSASVTESGGDTTDTATGEYITVNVTITNTGDKSAELS